MYRNLDGFMLDKYYYVRVPSECDNIRADLSYSGKYPPHLGYVVDEGKMSMEVQCGIMKDVYSSDLYYRLPILYKDDHSYFMDENWRFGLYSKDKPVFHVFDAWLYARAAFFNERQGKIHPYLWMIKAYDTESHREHMERGGAFKNRKALRKIRCHSNIG